MRVSQITGVDFKIQNGRIGNQSLIRLIFVLTIFNRTVMIWNDEFRMRR